MSYRVIICCWLALLGCSGNESDGHGASRGHSGALGTGGTATGGGATAASNGGQGNGNGGGSGATTSSGGSGATTDGGAPFADARGASESWASRTVENPPAYLGSVDNGADCSRSYQTSGFQPDSLDGAYPLFFYFVGTRFSPDDASARYDSEAAMAVTEAMARRGFVALSVDYDNSVAAWLDPTQENQLRCLFDASHGDNLLTVACALPQVECDKGIALWGHSQGAFVAHVAFNYDQRVRAVWTTGYGGNAPSMLDASRFRVVNGEADVPPNGTVAGVNAAADFTLAACPEGSTECLRPDGSGWILVQRSELADPSSSSADHCWFDRTSCLDATIRLEPNWTDPNSTKPFALELNADWVAVTTRR